MYRPLAEHEKTKFIEITVPEDYEVLIENHPYSGFLRLNPNYLGETIQLTFQKKALVESI